MAMRSNADGGALLNASLARLAGAVCGVLALAGAAVLAALLVFLGGLTNEMVAYIGGWIVVFVLMALVGGQLMACRTAAQRLLLAFWLLELAAAVVAAVAGQIWGAGWWTLPAPLGMVLAAAIGGGLLAVALLVAASSARSRLRFASYVAVSVAAAAVLAIVANVISQGTYLRRDVETLSRFGLSERTRKIIRDVKVPVRLTCVYTADDPHTADYRAAVMELLEDMHEANPAIEVSNAATASAKAKIVARLRGQLSGQADRHVKFLKDFRARSETLIKEMSQQQQRWSQAAEDEGGYLSMWSVTADLSRVLEKGRSEVNQVSLKVGRELSGAGLPDYASLAEDTTKLLTDLNSALEVDAAMVEKIAKVPSAVSSSRAKTLQALDEAAKAVEAMKGAPAPGLDAGVSLDKFIAAAGEASAKARAAGRALGSMAGPDNAKLLATCRYYRIRVPSGIFEVRTDLAEFYDQYVAAALDAVASEILAVRRVAKPEYYSQTVQKMETTVKDLTELMKAVTAAAKQAVDRLAKIDEKSDAMLKGAPESLGSILDPINALVEQSKKLPELKSATLTADLTSDNIVVIEATGKVAVATFDEFWPLKSSRREQSSEEGQSQQRSFNGDPAIASRLLALTSEPLATVLVTYFAPPQEYARLLPPADITPAELTALRKRLEEFNFEVKGWNLNDAAPAPNPGRPVAMLVLPPPPAIPTGGGESLPRFTPEHLAKVRGMIDAGTPAIFLAQFSPPRQMGFMASLEVPYDYNEYLQQAWGLTVLNGFIVIPAVADENDPGKFKISPERFSYFPLSTFTNQPIGKPLQAQRVVWTGLAPIVKAVNTSPGVTIQPVLEVPANWRDTWATGRISQLLAQLDRPGAAIAPDYAAGDIAAPIDVVVAATRKGSAPSSRPASEPASTQATSPSTAPATAKAPLPLGSRIVVMTIGAGLVDGYLDQRVGQLDARGALTFADPPRANADVVINSLLWLTGREHLIAAGPTQIKPVAMITPAMMNLLRGLCLIGLPLAVAVLGGVVLLVRRR